VAVDGRKQDEFRYWSRYVAWLVLFVVPVLAGFGGGWWSLWIAFAVGEVRARLPGD